MLGIGYIHQSGKLFFTGNGEEMYEMRIPEQLKDKRMYAAITLISRDDKLSFNFGKESFCFDLEERKEVKIKV